MKDVIDFNLFGISYVSKCAMLKIFSKAYFSVNLFLELLFLGSCVDLVGGVI